MSTRYWLWMLITLAVPLSASAHKASDSYLSIAPSLRGATAHWDIALRDLDRALALDADGGGQLTWAEVEARQAEIVAYALRQLAFSAAGRSCATDASANALGIVTLSDGAYARLSFTIDCPEQKPPAQLKYDFLFALDPQHRCIERTLRPDGSEQVRVLDAQTGAHSLELHAGGAATWASLNIVGKGVGHILEGIDHLLFLLALLLPIALSSRIDGGSQIRSQLGRVVKVVTAFTAAHSLTLALSGLGFASVSARVIEPAIAASVAIAALNNLFPVLGREQPSLAFALGLLHGFAFSSALTDAGLAGASLLTTLLSFNVGVELGQLAVVLLFLPLAFLIRWRTRWSAPVLRWGSFAIFVLAVMWVFQRVEQG